MSQKIIEELHNLRERDTTWRYYKPDVVKVDTGEQHEIFINPLPTNWTAGTNKYINGGFEISAQSFSTSLVNVVDGNLDTSYSLGLTSLTWIRLKLPTELKITSMKVAIAPADTAISFSIQGSNTNNGSDWVNLTDGFERIPDTLTLHEVQLTNPGYYLYYRVYISTTTNTNIKVHEVEIGSYTVDTINNYLTVSDIPNTLLDNQRIFLNTPDDMDTVGVTHNYLNQTPVDVLLDSGKYYELVYKSITNTFVAREVQYVSNN